MPRANIAKPFVCHPTSPYRSAHVPLLPNQSSSAIQNTLQAVPRVRQSSSGNSYRQQVSDLLLRRLSTVMGGERFVPTPNSPTELIYRYLGRRIQQFFTS